MGLLSVDFVSKFLVVLVGLVQMYRLRLVSRSCHRPLWLLLSQSEETLLGFLTELPVAKHYCVLVETYTGEKSPQTCCT